MESTSLASVSMGMPESLEWGKVAAGVAGLLHPRLILSFEKMLPRYLDSPTFQQNFVDAACEETRCSDFRCRPLPPSPLLLTLIIMLCIQANCMFLKPFLFPKCQTLAMEEQNLIHVLKMKKVESFQVKSDIRFRFATTQTSSTIRNFDNQAQDVNFEVAIPKGAFIVAFHMIIDGKRFNGRVNKRQTAGNENNIGQSVTQTPRDANIFEITVNVPAGSAATFVLTYQKMLQRRQGFYEYELYINPGQTVPNFLVDVQILENRKLTFVNTPALRTGDLITSCIDDNGEEKTNELAIINKTSTTTASVQFKPRENQQGEAVKGISTRFVIHYGVEPGKQGGDIMVFDSYFVHLIILDYLTLPKDIIFVLDQSGSMGGRKIEQLQQAMSKILSDLQPQDRFNIINFNHSPSKWKSTLTEANKNEVQQSKSYVGDMQAGGGTNINDALLTALSDLTPHHNKHRVSMIFFLTDGHGDNSAEVVAQNVLQANRNGVVAMYCLAFGADADFESLKTLCGRNKGFAKLIVEEDDAAEQVSCLYKSISRASIKNLYIRYDKKTVDEATLTKSEFPVVFNGTEISIYGLLQEGAQSVKYDILGMRALGELNISGEEIDVKTVTLKPNEINNQLLAGSPDRSNIVERMWAYQTITEKLVEKDIHKGDEKKTKELLEDVFLKSLKYNFVTPLTSIVVTKTDQGMVQIRKTNIQDDKYDFTKFNFTVPPSPTTEYPTTTTTLTLPPSPTTEYPTTITTLTLPPSPTTTYPTTTTTLNVSTVRNGGNRSRYSQLSQDSGHFRAINVYSQKYAVAPIMTFLVLVLKMFRAGN
ncbi:inter-alpha-trypsin inhibitor heavy chain h3 [Plakobranchus ocellatus]|uniref:Inter-alpha-trypsin inhibitor heavy chain h3 n=1 Tax=Plakobranchus ocellatus TaxID=259542 RepID=A0AAV3YJ17_9GAST|nr:inter-alpha-trypsin inhibitor heavy chain h3 [Plakobranchus ocellatus]